MVNVKSTLTGLCLLAATVSAASIHNEKRHVHHRRNKKPCSAPASVPHNDNNSTQSVNKALSTSSVPAVVTVSVVPVPVSPTPSEPVASGPATSAVGSIQPVSSAPAASDCGVATSYVTVQETITVTAGELPSTTSVSSSTSIAISISSSSSSTSSTSSSTSTSSSSSTPVAAVSKVKAPSPVVSAIIETPVPISIAPTTTSPSASAGAFLQASASSPAPAVTTSAAAAQPVSGGYTGGKMGMSWIPGGAWDALGITMPWVYDWGQVPDGVPSGTEYIPTLHDKDKCAGFAGQLASQSNVHFVKHFNEPDEYGYGGSGMSPGEAAGLHKQYISGLAGKYAVGLPAVTSNNNGMSGTNWLTAFVQETGCGDFSFADFHWYGASEATEEQAKIFLGYVDNWISVVDTICPNRNLPIWITEFSAGPTPGDVGQAAVFMATAGPALEANARIARYSYFFPTNNVLSAAVTAIDKALHQ